MAGQNDIFGINGFYPRKSGGFVWEQEDDPSKSKVLDLPSEMSFPSKGIMKMSPSGPTDFGIGKNIDGFKDSNGGCGMSFKDTASAGFAYKEDDARDVEIKSIVKFSGTGDHGFSLSACTGHHSSNSKHCCQGFAYMVTFEPGQNPMTARFRKEMYHVSYHTSPGGEKTLNDINFKAVDSGKWIGIGFCRYNKPMKDGTEDHVIVEAWINPDPDNNPNGWKRVMQEEDYNGHGWGDNGDVCDGEKDQCGTWSNAQNREKTNATSGNVQFKKCTLIEIDPLGVQGLPPGENPQPPTTGTISRDWIIKYNLVTFPDSACGIPLGTNTPVEFYNVPDGGSESNLHRDRYRACMMANGSGSKFIGKKVRRVKAILSRSGTLTGDVTCVLRRSGSDDVAVTFGYTGGTLDASTLTNVRTQYVFENTSSNYAWQNGDKICIEYSGNSSDTTNEVNVARSTDDPFDGSNSIAIKFDAGGPPPTSYGPPDTGRDYSWIMEEIT